MTFRVTGTTTSDPAECRRAAPARNGRAARETRTLARHGVSILADQLLVTCPAGRESHSSAASRQRPTPSSSECAHYVGQRPPPARFLPPAACTNAYHCAAASRLEPSRQAARPHDPVRSDSEGVEVADPIKMPGFAGYRPAKSSHRPASAVGGTAPSPGPGRVDNCRKNLRPARTQAQE